jgi:hypothetical protein
MGHLWGKLEAELVLKFKFILRLRLTLASLLESALEYSLASALITLG